MKKALLMGEKKYEQLWEVFKLLLTLSHGQAAVERGFSTNKLSMKANMNQESLIALRRVHDGMKHMDDYKNIVSSPRLK